ncbi:MAG: hypothetical protein ACJAVI_002434 [Candidatus Azotimanducaceae bacterium]
MTQLSLEVVTEGVSGMRQELINNVNVMADNLITQVCNISDVAAAVANGVSLKRY